MLSDLMYRIRALFRRNAVDTELHDELRFHFDRLVEKFIQSGLAPDEARRLARVEMRGIERVKADCREARGVTWIENMIKDSAYAMRVLSKRPGFAAAVALSLALGIGANTAVFSLIDAVMWRMLPVKDPRGLVVLLHGQKGLFENGFTYEQYRLMRQRNQVLTDLAVYSPARMNVSVDGSIEPAVEGQLVSGNYFSLLGVTPSSGRAIGGDDDLVPNGHPVAMISYGYWKRRFGLASSTVGRTISISGTPFTIIGITPARFFGVEVGAAPDVYVPVMMQPAVMTAYENLLDRPIIYRTWLNGLGRLKPGVSDQQANAELNALFRQTLPSPTGKFMGFKDEMLKIGPAATGLSELRLQFSQPLFILMAIVAIVLLIACANTANLLLARATARRQEFATRLALGASRARLINQMLVESVVLAILGGVCGILLASWATRFLVAFMSSGRTPIVLNLNPDVRILTFTCLVSFATGILFGVAPAIRASGIDVSPALKKATGSSIASYGGLGTGKVLAVAQVVLSLLLLVGAGLFVRSLQKLNGQDGGFARESVLITRVEPKGSDQRGIPGAKERLDRQYKDLIQRVASIPGVRVAGMAQFTPTHSAGVSLPFESVSGETKRVFAPMIYPNYFAATGIPLIAGRDFEERDLTDKSPMVAVVNETFVRQILAGGSAVGRRVKTFGGLREIIGVVKDSRYTELRGETPAIAYQPFLQTSTGRGQMALYVRIATSPSAVAPRLREAVQNTDRSMPMFDIQTLAEEMDATLIQERLIATLSGFFGLLALAEACVGLYGLLAFSVVQRTGEMGIRIALGAGRGDVVMLVMREALSLVLIGVAIGVPLALAMARLASSQISGLLFGVQATDPMTIASATALLAGVAAVASYLPARRASRVDPVIALRNE